ncbi:MAG: hypothetical protein Q7T01_02535 [bacterium]|nr:hypothetical protein [bacterium]
MLEVLRSMLAVLPRQKSRQTRELSWGELIGMDLSGRELRLAEQEGTTQGTIRRVEAEGEGEHRMVRFHRAPVRTNQFGADPTVCEDGDSAVAVNTSIAAHGASLHADGTITFQIVYIGKATIYPCAH